MMDDEPNPGSPEAVELGCKCPVLDNAHGKGFPYGGDGPSFYVNLDCPLHGEQVDEEET